MEELIRALLLADGGVAALAGDRVNFGSHPQGEGWPGVVLNTISDAEGYTLRGPDGLSRARVQADCYALTYGEAKRFSRAVRTVLSGHSDSGMQGVFHAGSRDGREGGTNEAERPYRVSLDFLITYNN
ncbi:MAG: DUF3168 domain-containing protein [Paracoccaceae bacterium]